MRAIMRPLRQQVRDSVDLFNAVHIILRPSKSRRCGVPMQDLLTNPLIVPVKILRGHEVVHHEGVLGVAFHPSQPWLFTAGADASLCMFTN